MEEHSFDKLAKGLAEQAITRGRALKLIGTTLLGAVGLASLPSVAEAKKKKKKKRKKHHQTPPLSSFTCSLANCQAGGCGNPTRGETCACVTTTEGQNLCVDASTGPFQECTSSAGCLPGQVCVIGAPCGTDVSACNFLCT